MKHDFPGISLVFNFLTFSDLWTLKYDEIYLDFPVRAGDTKGEGLTTFFVFEALGRIGDALK